MGRGCWIFFAGLSALVACALFVGALTEPQDNPASRSFYSEDYAFGVSCCLTLLFAAFSVYSLSIVDKIGKEKKKEKREESMLAEMQMLRQQVGQQRQTQTQPQLSEEDMQIKVAGKLWKEGKRAAALEILESMPFNDRAQEILKKLRAQKE